MNDMLNRGGKENEDTQQELQKLLIAFRFGYTPLIFLFAMIVKGGLLFITTTSLLGSALVAVLIGNTLLVLHGKRISSTILAIAQIGLDLFFCFCVSLVTGLSIQFILPIIFALFLFGTRGGLLVALLSSLLTLLPLLAGAFFLDLNFSQKLFQELLPTWMTALLYFLVALLGGSLLQLTRKRDVNLLEQITDVVHQLRTPLSAVKWTLKILLDEDAGKNTKEQKELLLKGFASNERMVTLVNDVLAVSRLESGKFKYNFTFVQFEDLVQEVMRNLLPLALPKDIHIKFTAPQEPLPKWKMDSDRIRDVLQNLVDNAIKYTKDGGEIEIGAMNEGEHLHFFVKDTGIGIPDSAKGRIFSRFYRAANAIYIETNGSGLGLFIAQSVVRRHGGKIWFESVLEKGTTFHVTLPAKGS